MQELKPCPFCGGKAQVSMQAYNMAIASCTRCPAVQQVFSRPHSDTSLTDEQYLEGAASLWNTRRGI